ncbi:hypothetical protein LJ739_06330 [Aestuariibacter halophilus]|uniref:Uncharacterized protein n=1 Tax=Fluctibacter halophilus TaxID=226011 RepID=A0ABS8G6X7_9ALTE|nr:hypothetical protein [Aestuariibacter halophilus]MCC2615851.1 hypothetical protein [Aestuariibacter halophilus]
MLKRVLFPCTVIALTVATSANAGIQTAVQQSCQDIDKRTTLQLARHGETSSDAYNAKLATMFQVTSCHGDALLDTRTDRRDYQPVDVNTQANHRTD